MTYFLNALLFTLVQGILSAALSVLLALVAAPGYGKLRKLKRIVRPLFIFPQMVSPVFIILGLLIIWKGFPYGLWGVVIGHSFMNIGLCAIVLGERWQVIDEQWLTLSHFFGARDLFYFRKVMFPQLKQTLKAMFAIVFSFSVSSLAIPLVLGGGPQATTLEVLIYEKIKTEGNVHAAVAISLAQFILQLVVFFLCLSFLKKAGGLKRKNNYIRSPFSFSSVLTCLVALLLFLPFAVLGASAKAEILPGLKEAMEFSLGLAGAVAMVITFFIIIWNMYGSSEKPLKIPTLSSVLVGLAFILIFSTLPMESSLALFLILGCAQLITLTFLVLRFVAPPLTEMYRHYLPLLKIWGQSKTFTFKKVFWPLNKKTYLLGFLLAFCWSIGEFSTSAMIAPTDSTLPLYIQGLMSQYRLEQAAFASLLFLLTGFFASIIGDSLLDG